MNKIKYDAAYISYVESGESAAVFVARDIVWSIDTTGMWIDIIKLDGHKNNSGRWDFKYFHLNYFQEKKHPKYPTGISDEDKNILHGRQLMMIFRNREDADTMVQDSEYVRNL
mgnify:CR=1 FL=1